MLLSARQPPASPLSTDRATGSWQTSGPGVNPRIESQSHWEHLRQFARWYRHRLWILLQGLFVIAQRQGIHFCLGVQATMAATFWTGLVASSERLPLNLFRTVRFLFFYPG